MLIDAGQCGSSAEHIDFSSGLDEQVLGGSQ